ncbi:cystathionine gamma-lyase [Paragemmobacter ruber]|uniref:Cystathionine gamma-lyase n=1 Tax=Paragemmobacter ruber TaxID=1985673 RepID=A0ABW9YAW7_9RHOB|nr:cystathionine gamma-lyase [Rhodobacter ruber]NBE08914.1 cystathionine gamma-lyase [Rhodobacter ruber]
MTIRNDDDRRFADLLHHRSARLEQGDPITPPLVSAATYHLPRADVGGYVYGRTTMPTWDEVEAQMAVLEGAPCVSFPSGMAAISAALMAAVVPGRRVVLPSDGYYTVRLFAEQFLKGFGVPVDYVPTLAMGQADFTGAGIVYLETPSNPGLEVCDIAAVAARAHAAGAVVIVDNTTMTAVLQRPLDLGADLVVAADTKAPGGHSDVLFGHVAGRDAAVMARVRDWRKLSGAVPGSFEAWLVHRGMETLELRLSRMCASAQVVAERLAAHPKVRAVRYPGLPDDPSHAVTVRQARGFGFLIGMTLDSADQAEAFLAACPYLARATSFGATHSAGERRARWGDAVPEGFIRLSIGVEPVEALWDGIAEALAVV